jgi:hypothetical protein
MASPRFGPIIAAIVATTNTIAPGQTAPLPLLTYQGRLLESGQPANGDRAFVISILDETGKEQASIFTW